MLNFNLKDIPIKNGPGCFIGTIAVFLLILEGFRLWVWEHGIIRGILLIILIGFYLLCRKVIWPQIKIPYNLNRPILWTSVTLTIIGFILIFYFFLQNILVSNRVQDGVADQQQCSVRAIYYLLEGKNPYSHLSFIDMSTYYSGLKLLHEEKNCADFNPQQYFDSFSTYWRSIPLIPQFQIMPEFKSTQGNCAYLFQLFQSMMYKYGPMLLYIYCPFVLVFGAGGIAWSHLIGILLISYWLLKFGLKNTGSFFISISALLVFLFPYQLWWNSLYMGHSDLIPTIFLTFGLISWLENRNKTSALFMGLSLCSKTIPGLFLCPLLLRKPKDSWPFFIIIIFTFGPYFLWDFIGMRNYFMFPTFRIGDSTSLVYTITPFFGSIVKVACIMGITFIFFKLWGKNWDPFLAVDFSIVSISLSILASQQIHNNYWVWLMPLITIACIQSIGRNWSKFAEVNA